MSRVATLWATNWASDAAGATGFHGNRSFVMPEPVLTEEELAALETLAAAGPERALDKALRGRLALYKMIDETPSGWKITALGREALSATRSRRDSAPAQTPGSDDEASTPADGKRHYGRKSRDTSWLD